jgi:hypothetical protein
MMAPGAEERILERTLDERSAQVASATAPRTALPEEELQEVVALTRDVDTIELKLTVPEPDQLTIVRALGLDALQAQIRQVFFFDTPDLVLDGHGVVVRARRSQSKGDDTVVKLRPVVPSQLPRSLRESSDFGVELDASPQGYVCSGSLKGFPSEGSVLKAMTGQKTVRKLFTKEQQALFAEHAPDGLELDALTMLGPLLVLKLKSRLQDYDRKLVTEMWLYPDGSRILELSTKCAPTEAFQVAAETRAFLASRGVDLGSQQQTKTRSALEFFAKGLKNGKARRSQSPAKASAASTTTKSRA